MAWRGVVRHVPSLRTEMGVFSRISTLSGTWEGDCVSRKLTTASNSEGVPPFSSNLNSKTIYGGAGSTTSTALRANPTQPESSSRRGFHSSVTVGSSSSSVSSILSSVSSSSNSCIGRSKDSSTASSSSSSITSSSSPSSILGLPSRRNIMSGCDGVADKPPSIPAFVSDLGPFPLDYTFDASHVKRVFLVKKWQNNTAKHYARRVVDWLLERGMQVFVEPTTVADYQRPLPSIFDIMYHTDPTFSKTFTRTFPLAADAFPEKSSPAVAYFQNPENKPLPTPPGHSSCKRAPVPPLDYWSTFDRSHEHRDSLSKLDPRESIAFSRKHHSWQDTIDLCICVGGDGTLLHVSSLFPHKVPPTLPFGCGSFGFLMPFSPAKLEPILTSLFASQLRIFNRSRLAFKLGGVKGTDRRGAPIVPPFSIDDTECYHLLNEVVLKHTYGLNINAGISEIECRIDGEFLAKFQGDGLMIASPTGSTAYSMAAGGSIVHPALRCLLLSPIAPMTLSSRPIILPGQSTITLKPIHDSVLLEGKYGRVIQPEEVVTVRRSEYPIPVFARTGVTEDWVQDMGTRLNYSRLVRVRQQDDPVELDNAVAQGSWVQKDRNTDR